MARALGVTQKTAWFMNHRIRLAVQEGSFWPMSGEVEVDETFIGGVLASCTQSKREEDHRNRRSWQDCRNGALGAARGGRTQQGQAKVVPNVRRKTMARKCGENVIEGSEVFTDSLKSYADLSDAFFIK